MFENQFTSGDYGAKRESITTCWTLISRAGQAFRWALIPVCAGEKVEERSELVARLRAGS